MPLPRPPISLNTPIPNQPFSAEEVYYLESNQGRLPLGNGLYIDSATGAFTDIEPSPYIYCVAQYSNLPVTYPPYSCETEVNTAGVTSFQSAWSSCNGLTDFPCLDTSSGTDFRNAWENCTSLTSFPLLNVSNGTNFDRAWVDCTGLTSFPLLDVSSGIDFDHAWKNCESLTSFPLLDVSSGTDFQYAWSECTSLTSFPLLDVSSGIYFNDAWSDCQSLTEFPLLDVSNGVDFIYAWENCTSLISFPLLNVSNGTNFVNVWAGCSSLTTFPAGMFDTCAATNFTNAWVNCALNQTSVDNILVSLDTAGQSNGSVGINGGTSSTPGVAGWAAVASLEAKGWTVSVNGTPTPLPSLVFTAATNAEPVTTGTVQPPKTPEPDQEYTDLTTNKTYKWQRARLENGQFKADDPATPENEAWVWQWLPLDSNKD